MQAHRGASMQATRNIFTTIEAAPLECDLSYFHGQGWTGGGIGGWPTECQSPVYFFITTQALCPPKPKVLLMAARTGRRWASLKVKLRL